MKHYNLYFWQGEKRLIKRYLTRKELYVYICQQGSPERALDALESLDEDIRSLGYWNRFGWWHVQDTLQAH